MKKTITILAVSSSFLFTACALNSKGVKPAARKNEAVTKMPQVAELDKKLKAKEERQQDSKDMQRILAKKAKMDSSEVAIRATPQVKKITVEPIQMPKATTKLSDRDLYAELLKAYDLNNEISFFSKYQAFMSNYSDSALADDAIYLAGLMSLANRNYGPSLKYFNAILNKYSMSNKASSALYAKAVALKKMNLTEEAGQSFFMVMKKYPGSPEAMRAEAEMKILNR